MDDCWKCRSGNVQTSLRSSRFTSNRFSLLSSPLLHLSLSRCILGEQWMSKSVSFHKLKLTNNISDKNSYVSRPLLFLCLSDSFHYDDFVLIFFPLSLLLSPSIIVYSRVINKLMFCFDQFIWYRRRMFVYLDNRSLLYFTLKIRFTNLMSHIEKKKTTTTMMMKVSSLPRKKSNSIFNSNLRNWFVCLS